MTRTLRLKLPEDVYRSLVRAAERTGKSPEALAPDHLVAMDGGREDDPLEEFIGAFPGPVEGWVDRHDEHLGQTALSKMPTR